jgi:hypothetical protein
MPRERRNFVRRSGFRDASLVLIACEGAETEPNYFEALRADPDIHNPRLHIEVLQREDPSLSSPRHVLQMLDRFAAEFRIRPGDALWLVADRDPQSWSDEMLSEVAQQCQQRGYFLAISNPCFELWLLLHFEDVPNQPDERRAELLRNEDGLLKSCFGAHRRSDASDWEICKPHVTIAIGRSAALDVNPADRWPQQLGTRVHRLVERLLRVADE